MMSDPQPVGLVLPDSLCAIESVEQAIEVCCTSGLRPILIHAPVEGGGCTCGQTHKAAGKHPIAKNWQSHVYGRDELLDARARLKFVPNIGIVLGEQPGGEYLIAVDVDDANRFTVLELQLGALPATPRCDSGRGYRLIYEAPPEVDVKQIVNVTGVGGESGVDVKIKGGQIVVAPSVHASGRRYVWTKVGPIARLPIAWALELVKTTPPPWVKSFTPQTMQADTRAKKRAHRYLEVAVMRDAAALAGCGEGMRNDTLYKRAFALFSLCAGLYLSHEWAYVHDQLFQAGRSAGLPESEVRRTLSSAEKGVRESGAVRMPVMLAEPEPSRLPPPPGAPRQPHFQEESEFRPQRPSRPVIRVSTELRENVDAAVAALRADDNLYQRDGLLVHVTRVTREESEVSPHIETDDGQLHKQLVEGSPQIRETRLSTVRERLSAVAVFQKYVESADRWKPILPTDAIVSAVHDRGQWSGIPPIVGVVETPMFCPGGVIVQETGYDKRTGYLYLPSESFPVVNDENTTQDHARWAHDFMADVFADFPYVSAAHRSVAISAIMTLVGRPAIQGSIPAHLFDASTRGSGKTLQTDAIATTVTGRGAPRMNYTSDEVELEKILGGYALKGSSFICLDNVPTMRPFGGGPLDRVLTARDKVDLRVLGRTEVLTLTWRALIMATGNNMTLFGETARRVLMARLDPIEENPERRTQFKHNALLAYVRTQRPRLVAAALLILRAYYRAGCPNMGCARWGSFEEWSRLIPHAIVFAGGADPMLARPEQDEDVDVETQALACMLDQLPKLHTKLHEIAPESVNGVGVAARTIVSALYEQNPEWPEFEPLRDAVEILCKPKYGKAPSKPDAATLGYKLRSMRSRVLGGRKLIGKPGEAHVTMWRVEKTDTKIDVSN